MSKPNKASQIVIGRNYPDPYAPQPMTEGYVWQQIAIYFAYNGAITKAPARQWKGRIELYPKHNLYNYSKPLGWH